MTRQLRNGEAFRAIQEVMRKESQAHPQETEDPPYEADQGMTDQPVGGSSDPNDDLTEGSAGLQHHADVLEEGQPKPNDVAPPGSAEDYHITDVDRR